jgi:PIN domain nuclease of toxin-antitoxin system
LLVDASVVLAVYIGEPGSEYAAKLLHGSAISVVNLSEVYRKLIDSEVELKAAVATVAELRMEPIAFDDRQAVEAARLRPLTRHIGASFADRACLGLALLEGYAVLTADRKWSLLDLPIQIRQIRA